MSGFGSFLFGNPGRMQQTPLYTPQQTSTMNQLMGTAMQGLGNNQFDFAPIEAQARKGFSQQTIPSLAERFTSMGSGGGQRSSAFQGALGGAGADFESNLAALRSQYGLQQQGNMMNMLGMSLRPQFENNYFPSSGGLFGGMGGGMGQAGGSGLMELLPLLFGL